MTTSARKRTPTLESTLSDWPNSYNTRRWILTTLSWNRWQNIVSLILLRPKSQQNYVDERCRNQR